MYILQAATSFCMKLCFCSQLARVYDKYFVIRCINSFKDSHSRCCHVEQLKAADAGRPTFGSGTSRARNADSRGMRCFLRPITYCVTVYKVDGQEILKVKINAIKHDFLLTSYSNH